MKKIFILFICVFLANCTSKQKIFDGVACPEVLFSKNHSVYITSKQMPITLDNISYSAKINNYFFDGQCKSQNNNLIANLKMLFIVYPDNASEGKVEIPYYIALLDDKKNIVEINYYKVKGVLSKNIEEKKFIETEINSSQEILIHINEKKINKILIGFMIDKEKLKILN